MIHKQTGQVGYAILSFDGFLGIGAHVYPIPWEKLTYDVGLHVYRVALTCEQLEKAPTLRLDDADRPTERSYGERMYEYYGATNYWGHLSARGVQMAPSKRRGETRILAGLGEQHRNVGTYPHILLNSQVLLA